MHCKSLRSEKPIYHKLEEEKRKAVILGNIIFFFLKCFSLELYFLLTHFKLFTLSKPIGLSQLYIWRPNVGNIKRMKILVDRNNTVSVN